MRPAKLVRPHGWISCVIQAALKPHGGYLSRFVPPAVPLAPELDELPRLPVLPVLPVLELWSEEPAP